MFDQQPLKQGKPLAEAEGGELQQGFMTHRLRPSFHCTTVEKSTFLKI